MCFIYIFVPLHDFILSPLPLLKIYLWMQKSEYNENDQRLKISYTLKVVFL